MSSWGEYTFVSEAIIDVSSSDGSSVREVSDNQEGSDLLELLGV